MNLTGEHLEVEAVEGAEAAELLDQSMGGDHRGSGEAHALTVRREHKQPRVPRRDVND